MSKLATALIIGSLALGGYGLANADSEHQGKHQYQGKHCKKGAEERLKHMTKELGLSEQQVTQIRTIKDKYTPAKKALRVKMKDTRKKLREAMHADTVDKAKIRKLSGELGNLKTEKVLMKVEMRSEINKVLTKDQQAKKKAMFKARRDSHRKGQGERNE